MYKEGRTILGVIYHEVAICPLDSGPIRGNGVYYWTILPAITEVNKFFGDVEAHPGSTKEAISSL